VTEAIVLAAGLATRMGVVKPLTPIEGEPALEVIVRRIREAGIARPIVVLGSPSAAQIKEAIDLRECVVVDNDVPEVGMSHSLRLGLDALPDAADGVLVFHADMPFVQAKTIRAVLRAADRGAVIAAPLFGNRRGFPVFFHRVHIRGLRETLSGDVGGRTYIEGRRKDLTTVAVDDPGCVYDVDRPSDLAEWKGDRACAISA